MPHERLDFRVDATGLTIAADAWGDPSAAIVLLLHGGGQTRHAWGGTGEALAAAGFRAIAIDLRGHGESSFHPTGDYSTEGFVADLRGVARLLPRAPLLVGASLGGITGLMAETDPAGSFASGLVLVDVTPRLEIEGVKRIIAFMAARPDGFASLDDAADFIAAYLPHRPRPRDVEGLRKNLRRGDDGRFRWHWDPMLMARWNPERFDPEEGRRIVAERLDAARKLRVPALLVRGRMSEIVTEAAAREFLEACPHAEYVDLAAAGHMVAGDRNDAFTAAVVDFAKRHEKGAATPSAP